MMLKTAACIVALANAVVSKDVPRIIDLSQDIPQDDAAMSSSPGALAIQQAALQDPFTRSAIVIEDGDIVASYYRDDVDPNEDFPVHSVTKSWTSLLFGIMIDNGLLSLDETLGDIFPSSKAWSDVTDGSIDFRKSITVEEMLTMTSGLILNPERDIISCLGGCSLEDSLAISDADGVKGEFNYLALNNVPSYIIKERSGMTPKQYLDANVMGKLGIGKEEYDWSWICSHGGDCSYEEEDQVQVGFSVNDSGLSFITRHRQQRAA